MIEFRFVSALNSLESVSQNAMDCSLAQTVTMLEFSRTRETASILKHFAIIRPKTDIATCLRRRVITSASNHSSLNSSKEVL